MVIPSLGSIKVLPRTKPLNRLLVFCFWAVLVVGIIAHAGVLFASESLIKEVALPEGLSSAQTIAIDQSGYIWFTEKIGKKLTRLDPEKKEFTSFPLPASWGEVGFATFVLGQNDEIWFTVRRWAQNAQEQYVLGKYTPSDGFFTKFNLSIDAVPEELLVDDAGVIWFVASNKNRLYRVDPENFSFKGYPIPTPNGFPRSLAVDAEGFIWFVEPNANKIGKFDPGKELFYEYDIPTPFANPGKIAIDRNGKVWFVQLNTNRIGAFYPDLERFDEALIPTRRSSPNAIAADANGNIWFLEYRGNKVGVFLPESALFKEYEIPTFSSLPGDMVIDHKRSMLWFTEGNTEAKRLGVLSIADALAQTGKEDSIAQNASSRDSTPQAASSGSAARWLLYFLILAVIAVLAIGRLKHLKGQREGEAE